MHHTQLIARLIAEGRVRVDRAFERVIYHEPCYLARHNGEYEAPRAIIAQLTRTRRSSSSSAAKRRCAAAPAARECGWKKSIGRRINITRVEQALPQQPQVIATACPYCATMMSDGAKALGREAEIATRDIAELVAEALIADRSSPSREAPPTSSSPAVR